MILTPCPYDPIISGSRPWNIDSLDGLTELRVNMNKIKALPKSIGNLARWTQLNQIKSNQNGVVSGFEMCFDIGSQPHRGCQNTPPYAQGCDLS